MCHHLCIYVQEIIDYGENLSYLKWCLRMYWAVFNNWYFHRFTTSTPPSPTWRRRTSELWQQSLGQALTGSQWCFSILKTVMVFWWSSRKPEYVSHIHRFARIHRVSHRIILPSSLVQFGWQLVFDTTPISCNAPMKYFDLRVAFHVNNLQNINQIQPL